MTQAQATLSRIQAGAYTPDSAARSFQYEDGSQLVLVGGSWLAWNTTPASAKDLRAKGILNRHELFAGNGERFGLVIESGGKNEGSKPVAVVTQGEPKPVALDSVTQAKSWIESQLAEAC